MDCWNLINKPWAKPFGVYAKNGGFLKKLLARSHLAMIENGDKQPNFETIWRLANAFGLYPHELVKLIEEERLRSTS